MCSTHQYCTPSPEQLTFTDLVHTECYILHTTMFTIRITSDYATSVAMSDWIKLFVCLYGEHINTLCLHSAASSFSSALYDGDDFSIFSTMSRHFYYSTCPLCQQDVDVHQTDTYRILPLDLERIASFHERPGLDERPNVISGLLRNGGSYISCTEDYPS